MRGIGVEKTAAIVAQQLDRFLAGDRSDRNGLFPALQRRYVDRPKQGLRRPQGQKQHSDNNGQGQQHIERGAGHIDPEIADRFRLLADKSAGEAYRHRHGGGGIEEIVSGEASHLGEMTHRRFAGIGLPIGVGDETDGGVEGEIGGDSGARRGVERQEGLTSLDGIKREEAEKAESQHRKRIGQPVLFLVGIDAREPIERSFQRRDDRGQKVPAPVENHRHESTKRPRQRDDRRQNAGDFEPACQVHVSKLVNGQEIHVEVIIGRELPDKAIPFFLKTDPFRWTKKWHCYSGGGSAAVPTSASQKSAFGVNCRIRWNDAGGRRAI